MYAGIRMMKFIHRVRNKLAVCHVLLHIAVPVNFYSNTACIQNIRLQHACMLCVGGMDASMTHYFKCCVKSVADAVAIYCTDIISHGAVSTQKRQLS